MNHWISIQVDYCACGIYQTDNTVIILNKTDYPGDSSLKPAVEFPIDLKLLEVKPLKVPKKIRWRHNDVISCAKLEWKIVEPFENGGMSGYCFTLGH